MIQCPKWAGNSVILLIIIVEKIKNIEPINEKFIDLVILNIIKYEIKPCRYKQDKIHNEKYWKLSGNIKSKILKNNANKGIESV